MAELLEKQWWFKVLETQHCLHLYLYMKISLSSSSLEEELWFGSAAALPRETT